MVKLKIGTAVFFVSLCSLFYLPACTFKGSHKPVPVGGLDKPGGGEKGTGEIVTFGDVKSILENRCASCHVKDHKWALDPAASEAKRAVVKDRVGGRTMPMVGSAEAKAMTDDERAKVLAWAEGKALGGKATGGTAGQTGGGTSGKTPAPTPAQPTPAQVKLTEVQTRFVERCQACHGEQGLSQMETVPNLAESHPDYLLGRLFYFSTPKAVGTMMPQQIADLAKEFGLKTEKDKATMDLLTAAVNFFSGKKLAVTADEKKAERAKLAAADMARYTRGQEIVTAANCVMCHRGADGKPIAGAPMIFSQRLEFLTLRFKQFEDKSVENTPGKATNDQTMPGIIEGLRKDLKVSDADLEAVSLYLSLTAPEEAPALK